MLTKFNCLQFDASQSLLYTLGSSRYYEFSAALKPLSMTYKDDTNELLNVFVYQTDNSKSLETIDMFSSCQLDAEKDLIAFTTESYFSIGTL